MKNKYLAYSYLSIKTLLLNKSILFGFLFSLIVALIATLYVIIFQPDIPSIDFRNNPTYHFTNSLGALNVIILIIVLFLFGNVATMMQSVIDDRDSKVSEIINTSISEYHYLVGKIITSFLLIIITLINTLLAIIIALMIFSIFNPYDFEIYSDILKPLLTSMNFETILFLIGCLGIGLLMLTTSILFTLSISIKANSVVDGFPVSLIVLTPYFLLFGLFIFLPTDNSGLWISLSSILSFVPVFSPIFILMSVMLNGFTILNGFAIIISILYLIFLFKGTVNIYSYAFYMNEKLSVSQLLKFATKKKETWLKNFNN